MEDQWARDFEWDFASKCKHKAEALVELLEVELCGSVGGFAPGQPEGQNLRQRFEFLASKVNYVWLV